jgi:hypothetical protein
MVSPGITNNANMLYGLVMPFTLTEKPAYCGENGAATSAIAEEIQNNNKTSIYFIIFS